MATPRKTQREKILNFLASGRQLTVNEATRLGIARLSSRIHELREEGFVIYTNSRRMKGGVNRGRKVTAYRLDNADQEFVRTNGVV